MAGHRDDVRLAEACLSGEQQALARFEQIVQATLPNLARFRLAAHELDEVLQTVRTKLLVQREAVGPGLANYAGEGPLGAFVRVVAVRTALNYVARVRQSVATQWETISDVVLASKTNPEIEELKRIYKPHVELALENAWRQLTADSRLLLQHYILDELSIDELATVYKVHRSTAARRVLSAKDKWLVATKEQLTLALSLPTNEIDSLLFLVKSCISLDLEQFARK